MATSFSLEILTPAKKVCSEQVTEVLLPAYDGETGVLPQHGDFIGVLGTGVLKLVREGNDHWFMVSSGIYQVKEGAVTVFADVAEPATEVDIEQAKADVEKYSGLLNDVANFDPQNAEEHARSLKLAESRIEVNRRTSLMN